MTTGGPLTGDVHLQTERLRLRWFTADDADRPVARDVVAAQP